jgi:urease accessory protein UreE
MAKAEISWKSRNEEGVRREVYAHHVGNRWRFYVRENRFDEWEEMTEPPLDDWKELLDGVVRRINRRLLRPEEEARVRALIHEHYPDAEI